MNLTFNPVPGQIYDVIWRMNFEFNLDRQLNQYLVDFRPAMRKKVIELLARFPSVPEEISVFFHLSSGLLSFISQQYFIEDYRCLKPNFGIESFIDDLINTRQVQNQLFRFYLGDHCPRIEEESMASLFAVQKMVMEQDFPPHIKNHLCLFAVSPQRYMDAIITCIRQTYDVVLQMHAENQELINEVGHRFCTDPQAQRVLIDLFKISSAQLEPMQEYSVVLLPTLHCHYICATLIKGQFILGPESIDYRCQFVKSLREPDIMEVCRTLGDDTRMKIFKMLCQNHEMSTGEIAMGVGMTMNAVFYHLNMMYNCGLLLSRGDKKRVYYSVDQKFFERYVEAMKRAVPPV